MKDDPSHNWQAANGGKRALGKHAGYSLPYKTKTPQEQRPRPTERTMSDDHGYETTEARVLPTGGDGNIICGRRGYEREIAFRRERNRELSESCRYPLPAWESLAVYFRDGEYLYGQSGAKA